jgi:hypothetical protein
MTEALPGLIEDEEAGIGPISMHMIFQCARLPPGGSDKGEKHPLERVFLSGSGSCLADQRVGRDIIRIGFGKGKIGVGHGMLLLV